MRAGGWGLFNLDMTIVSVLHKELEYKVEGPIGNSFASYISIQTKAHISYVTSSFFFFVSGLIVVIYTLRLFITLQSHWLCMRCFCFIKLQEIFLVLTILF